MKNKRAKIKIPFEAKGSFSEVINDFITVMSDVTGGTVDVDISLKGKVTIYFEDEIETRPNINIDVLYRGDYMNELKIT